jgi:hypothetical protein
MFDLGGGDVVGIVMRASDADRFPDDRFAAMWLVRTIRSPADRSAVRAGTLPAGHASPRQDELNRSSPRGETATMRRSIQTLVQRPAVCAALRS